MNTLVITTPLLLFIHIILVFTAFHSSDTIINFITNCNNPSDRVILIRKHIFYYRPNKPLLHRMNKNFLTYITYKVLYSYNLTDSLSVARPAASQAPSLLILPPLSHYVASPTPCHVLLPRTAFPFEHHR